MNIRKILFLIFINDLENGILKWLLKFDDDTKVFTVIETEEDSRQPQEDLDKLYQWSELWLIVFNIDKN